MKENRKRILDMLESKKISVEEAERLLGLVDEPVAAAVNKKTPQYLRVSIKPGDESCGDSKVERVNIRVPLALIRAGVKFTSLIPNEAADKVDDALREKGIKLNIRNLKDEDIEQLVVALSDLEVDIEDGKAKINVYTE
ncbi:hypothetical protein ACFLYS_03060 [Chloroflexota bacterium]